MRIGIDVDGVLRDIQSVTLDAWYLETGIRKYPEDIVGWSLYQYLEATSMGLSEQEFYAWWFAQEDLWANAPAILHSQRIVTQLAENHTLFAVTSQPTPVTRRATIHWLDTNFPDVWTGIFFSRDKGVLSLDVLVDDYWCNLEMSSAPMKLLFWQPWNADRIDFEHVKGWREITDQRIGYLNQQESAD